MKILIIEDEKLASEKLNDLLLELDPNYQIVGVTRSVDESIEWLNQNESPDLILSDIHLNDGLCFNIYENVEVQCPIIFTTAYEKYAIQAFELNSIDYLLKPIQKERLEHALQKLERFSDVSSKNSVLFDEFKTILEQSNREYKARFLCKLGNKIKSVPIEKIMYFYSQDRITFIVDLNGNRLPVNNTLDEIDQMIDPKSFFKLNRKFIAHFNSIDEIHPYFKGRVKLKLNPNFDEDIVVSSERTPLFKSWLDR